MYYYNDKDLVDVQDFKKYHIDYEDRDFTIRQIGSDSIEYRLNFTGFIVGEDSQLTCVFPYGYKPANTSSDANILFRLINRKVRNNTDVFFGDQQDDEYRSNYPFASFFSIYEYYKNYGLYVRIDERLTTDSSGTVSWKDTIARSAKYIIDDSLMFSPIYYTKTSRSSTFLTECMSFIIESTLNKFGDLIGEKTLGIELPAIDFLNHREEVLRELYLIKSRTYNNIYRNLIASMITFFKNIKEGGDYYFKYYNFEYIWEDALKEYLNSYFIGVSVKNDIELDITRNSDANFEKQIHFLNICKPRQNIQPDLVYEDDTHIYLFDAKYYNPSDLDYKQLCYTIFMQKENKEMISGLISPGEEYSKECHFQMDPEFNSNLRDLKVMEYTFNIREVLTHWLGIEE